MAISFDEIWTNVKKNAFDAKDIAEYKLRTARINLKIDEAYKKLGEAYYTAASGGENKTEAIVDSIRAMKNELSELEDEIARLVGTVRCPECGVTVTRTYSFCPHCGTALPVEEKTVTQQEFENAFDEAVGKKIKDEDIDFSDIEEEEDFNSPE